jgi:hypothetical protein
LLRQGTVRAGEQINLQAYGETNLWLEVNLEPTAMGRLRQFFYQPSIVRLSVWEGVPVKPAKQFRSPPPMLAAGFIASPLLLSSSSLLDAYSGKPVTRPSAYAVEIAPSDRFLWQERISYRIYKTGNPNHSLSSGPS